jgi:pimeloyl-ACP methyl ester carboxylesterase
MDRIAVFQPQIIEPAPRQEPPPAPERAEQHSGNAEHGDGAFSHGLPLLRTGRGEPVIYLPGLGRSSATRTAVDRWLLHGQIASLAKTFDVWLIERRAGLSLGTTIAQLADDYANRIRADFNGPVDVIGVSTGGTIALQLAIDHPDVVRRLVLVSAAYRLSDAGRAAQSAVAAALRTGHRRRAAACMLAATTTRPAAARLLWLVGLIVAPLVVGRRYADLITTIEAEDGFDVGEALSSVSIPTVVLGGAKDGYYSPELFERTANRLANGQYIEYPSSSHLSTLGAPGVTRSIRTVLQPPVASPRPLHSAAHA